VTSPTLLTMRDVGEQLRCSPKTVQRMIARGDLPAVRLSRGMVRVRNEDVQHLIDACYETTSSAGTAWGAGPIYPAGSRWWDDA
jgi:excisionase family DNA binding protein